MTAARIGSAAITATLSSSRSTRPVDAETGERFTQARCAQGEFITRAEEEESEATDRAEICI